MVSPQERNPGAFLSCGRGNRCDAVAINISPLCGGLFCILKDEPGCDLIRAMPIMKKRDHQTESRLLLESADPIELPPAEIADDAVLVQFDKFKAFIPELLDALRAGTMA